MYSQKGPAADHEVDFVNDLVPSQEDNLQNHRTVREISHETIIRLRCDDVTIMSLVVAFYWNTV